LPCAPGRRHADARGKKTAEAIQNEIAREVATLLARIFADRKRTGRTDLEAVEMAFRAGLHQAGAAALSQLLQFPGPAAEQRLISCSCGYEARYRELRSRRILTALGAVKITRPWYLCPHCHQGQFPADHELDIVNTDFSPGVRRMHALLGQQAPFDHGREQMNVLAGLDVTTKAVERTAESIGQDIEARQQIDIRRAKQLHLPVAVGPPIPYLYVQMDGTQVFVVKSETEGRAGRIPGQPARTRECKLGAVFTQTTVDEQGRPVRDEDSTTYVGAIESAEDFGLRLYTEAWNRGWDRATIRVVMGDGSHWIWNIADQHFPGAIQIVDLYHAREHLWDIARKLYPADEVAQKRWLLRKLHWLDHGKIEQLVAALRKLADAETNPEVVKALMNEAEYFDANRDRMRYPEFRKKGLFVGSGVIEAGCKTVIGSRLKRSGMFWTVRGANAIIALRCCCLSGKFEAYWEERAG
jgi:hypothetical protein